MKNKIICALVLSLIFTCIRIPQAEIINNSTSNQQTISKKDDYYTELDTFAQQKAKLLFKDELGAATSVQYAICKDDTIVVSNNVNCKNSNINIQCMELVL